MFSRKPQTILTSKKMNEKFKTKKTMSLRDAEFTSPAELHENICYISVGGVTMPLSK